MPEKALSACDILRMVALHLLGDVASNNGERTTHSSVTSSDPPQL